MIFRRKGVCNRNWYRAILASFLMQTSSPSSPLPVFVHNKENITQRFCKDKFDAMCKALRPKSCVICVPEINGH